MFFRLSQMYQIFVTIAEMPAHYETDFGVSSAEGAGNTKIGFIMCWHFSDSYKNLIHLA